VTVVDERWNDPTYVRIFDTTLRDGEQSPGASMTSAEKLKVASALAQLGVDIIEAGFPAASPDDLAAVQHIASTVGRGDVATPTGLPPVVCGLARANRRDIDKAFEAVAPAARPRIHTFLATSDLHLDRKLRMTRDEALEAIRGAVGYARGLCADVEFSPEDAGRSDPEFLKAALEAAIEAGATTLNIPDTVGYTVPEEFGQLIAFLQGNTRGIERAVLSVHCHNDLGLATANSLAGVLRGARQVEVAVNGIGERAGNTSLEEIVMICRTRHERLGLHTGVDSTQLTRVSRLVQSCTGMLVQPNKAIVGANAFAHEAGIHQDGMLKDQSTYEIMRPEMVGAAKSTLVLGKHSGRAAIKARLAELGYPVEGDELRQVFDRFKSLADRKKVITDRDLETLVVDELVGEVEHYTLSALQVMCGNRGMATATVRLRGPDGEERVHAATGTGPVDAVYEAIDRIVDCDVTLLEFNVQGVTEGIDALGEVTVRVSGGAATHVNAQHEAATQRSYHGHGASTDIVEAAAFAYLAALNKIIDAGARRANATAEGALA
jgi:2-isopropylmalate synthase